TANGSASTARGILVASRRKRAPRLREGGDRPMTSLQSPCAGPPRVLPLREVRLSRVKPAADRRSRLTSGLTDYPGGSAQRRVRRTEAGFRRPMLVRQLRPPSIRALAPIEL